MTIRVEGRGVVRMRLAGSAGRIHFMSARPS